MTAANLARRVRDTFALSVPATTDELLHVCACLGLTVVCSPDLHGLGFYVSGRIPAILVRLPVSPPVLAHELSHHLTTDPHDLEARICAYAGREGFAEAFARELCPASG